MSNDLASLPPGIDLNTLPLAEPPYPSHSDFTRRSELLTPTIVVVAILMPVLTILVALRVWSKIGRDGKWKFGDWLLIVTFLITAGNAALLLVIMPKFGRDSWDISIGFITSAWAQKIIFCEALTSPLTLFLGKMCILTLYWDFFGHITHVRWQIIAAMFFSIPLFCSAFILASQSAPPIGKAWGTAVNDKNSDRNCLISMIIGVVNLVVDLLIFYIPIPIVSQLNMNRKKKAGVLAIFMTGSIAIIADAIVMYYRVKLYKSPRDTRAGQIVPLCSLVEASISMICSSMPSLAKIWRFHIVPSSLYTSLRQRWTSKSGQELSYHGTSKPRESPRRKKGPYSIPTTRDLRTEDLSRNDDLELLTVPQGYERPIATITKTREDYIKLNDIEVGKIQRVVDWDQHCVHRVG